jgi:hypothetical protein
MEIRDSEKLILTMFAEMHEHLKIKSEINPTVVKEAIRTGNAWSLDWQFPALFEVAEVPAEMAYEEHHPKPTDRNIRVMHRKAMRLGVRDLIADVAETFGRRELP